MRVDLSKESLAGTVLREMVADTPHRLGSAPPNTTSHLLLLPTRVRYISDILIVVSRILDAILERRVFDEILVPHVSDMFFPIFYRRALVRFPTPCTSQLHPTRSLFFITGPEFDFEKWWPANLGVLAAHPPFLDFRLSAERQVCPVGCGVCRV